jgi:hypothetical protein
MYLQVDCHCNTVQNVEDTTMTMHICGNLIYIVPCILDLALYPRPRAGIPGTYWTGGWVDLKTCVDAVPAGN